MLASLKANWFQSPDTEGSHMAWMHDCTVLCCRIILYCRHGFLVSCIVGTLQSSSLRPGNSVLVPHALRWIETELV